MSSKSKSMLIGKTKLNAEIRICNNCECYSNYPHFIYKCGNKTVLISLIEEKFIDYQDNIDLAARDDIEIFFSTINKKYKMTNWEVVKKIWNENNNKQIPKHSHKPYYRNLVENVDYANISFGNKDKLLEGGKVYCSAEVEQEPHFHYELADKTDVAISFLEPEYLYPIKRKLTEQEINNLINFFKADMPEHHSKFTNWEFAIYSWNNQNCYSDKESIYPPYKELDENLQMPDYRILNNEEKEFKLDISHITQLEEQDKDYIINQCLIYGFDNKVILELFNYCNEKNISNKEYYLALAKSWYDNNIRTNDDLKNYFEKSDNLKRIVETISKIVNKELTQYEECYIEKWLYRDNMEENTIITIIKENNKFDVNIIDKKLQYKLEEQ